MSSVFPLDPQCSSRRTLRGLGETKLIVSLGSFIKCLLPFRAGHSKGAVPWKFLLISVYVLRRIKLDGHSYGDFAVCWPKLLKCLTKNFFSDEESVLYRAPGEKCEMISLRKNKL